MLIEVHVLQNHAPSNLNRDDTGSPKEAVFGGFKRARISSQCLKRSIRRSDIFQGTLEDRLATRTRSLPELVRKQLKDKGLSEEMAEIGAKKASGFGTDKGTETKPNASGHYRTAQTMFLSDADITSVVDVICEAAQESKTAKKFEKVLARKLQEDAKDKGARIMPVDVALFGRMITSEAFLDVDASSQFAHAISTHKIDHEFDYYTAVDDLERSTDDEAGGGADMIGDVEFNSACYYKYFNIHVDGLVDNLTGKPFGKSPDEKETEEARAVAAMAIQALVEAACRVTPSGKQNSFAAHQLPSLLWIEIRDKNLPVSYANAFSTPVNPKMKDGLEVASAVALKNEAEALTERFSLEARKRLLLARRDDFAILDTKPETNLTAILEALEEEVKRG